jgi:SAM-dependent methyltransferase
MPTPGDAGPVPLGSLQWGDLRRLEPVSDKWGFDRGLPVDRFYIEAFLDRHRDEIAGRCLEVMNGNYTRRFGGERVTRADVVDINPRNPNATIVGDLLDPATLEPAAYDCIVLTQTLNVIYDCGGVLRRCHAALRPGGTLLVTAPACCRYSPHPEDFWRFTDRSLERLLEDNAPRAEVAIEMCGNLVASIAFLTGLASGELTPAELAVRDDRFPIVVTAHVRKPPNAGASE